ncbi:MAG: insulinase family protein [Lachnospiraceae bacterium]|nr:insulinase family protein [Lachnospiraceae bacterium]
MNIPEEYELQQQEQIDELETEMRLLRHKKSGARVLLMSNDDENKVFSIAFRTPVSDSTGVPHIIEHTVLCGSEKYPVKDPFMELAKSSLSTFLNAFTFPDKTMYPVSSCNAKDLRNLMSVYMDAVFHPNIYREKMIFMQEGWHYEMEDVNAPLRINGVVYNEMKGAFSDPEEVLDRFCQNSLYPDTGYGFESGGDPEVIPSLTYEDYLDFHRRYYHPSNSYIYLYGDMDMEDQLRWLDREYLSEYTEIDPHSEIRRQKPFDSMNEYSISYPIPDDEDTADRTWESVQWSAGDMLDPELYLAMQVLDYALLSSEGAPVKEALLGAGIGQDVFGGWYTDCLQPFFRITAKNMDSARKDDFMRVIMETLRDVAQRGPERTSLEAALNTLEFKTREADYGGFPKGLVWSMGALESWLYDDEQPVLHLRSEEIFKTLRAHLDDGYYSDLIRKYLTDNDHCSLVIAVPEAGLATRRDKQLAERLAAMKSGMTHEELAQIVADTSALSAYQDEDSTPEQLSTLPHLELSDLRREVRDYPTSVSRSKGIRFLHHETFTRGITYAVMLFDISALDGEEILDAALLRDAIALLDTGRHTYGELSDEINLKLGGLDIALTVREKADGSGFTPYFEVSCKFFREKAREAAALIHEILKQTLYTSETRLATVIGQQVSRNEMRTQSMAHSIAAARVLSYESPAAAFREYATGLEYMRRIAGYGRGEIDTASLLIRLSAVAKRIFTESPMTVSITDESQGFEDFSRAVTELFDGTGTVPAPVSPVFMPLPKRQNEGLRTTSQVNYVALGGIWRESVPYSGAFQVLRTILSNEYLWNAVRVKGGAYGIMCSFTRGGTASFVSYRDPNLEKTYETYRTLAEYVRNFSAEKRKMDDLIISVIGALDTPLTPQMKGMAALSSYLGSFTREERQKERDEIIGCTAADIRALAPALQTIIDKWQICTVGSAAGIDGAGELFMKTENLL